MFLPARLEMLGAGRVGHFFSPTPGNVFEHSRYTQVAPSEFGALSVLAHSDDTLTIVFNPEDYEPESVASIPGRVWLWFLRRMAHSRPESFPGAQRLVEEGKRFLAPRMRYLESLLPLLPQSFELVVSDSDSRDYMRSVGVNALMSPPPLNIAQIHSVATTTHQSIIISSQRTDYSDLFVSEISNRYRTVDPRDDTEPRSFFEASHVVSVGETVFPSFSVISALSLAAGQTLITDSLNPLWGFEPGLDFIHVSSPKELLYVCEMLSRYPRSTQLMTQRARNKARSLDASKVIQRLIREAKKSDSP